ncbi:hypothetical protein J4475_04120 [Candidatus Woesearchaeota archaeon]|nr:hypothetical protein [Candidatus Woesearchaeota archaeon]
MNPRHGMSVIVYDNNGGLYFLIFRRNTSERKWQFLRKLLQFNEDAHDVIPQLIEKVAGIKTYKLKERLTFEINVVENDEVIQNTVFFVEASMNVPVHMSKEKMRAVTYLWTQESGVADKLSESDRNLFHQAVAHLKARLEQ